MTNEANKIFVPDPPPEGMDPVAAEWILRQLGRINNTTSVVEVTQKEQDAVSDQLRQDLDAHTGDQTNPHNTTHVLLPDGTDGDPHIEHVSDGGAGITLSAPTTALTQILPTYTALQWFDEKDTPEKGATADIANGWITFQETGFWLIGAVIVIDVVADAANQTRDVAIRLYETAGPTELKIISQVPIPRYGERITLGGVIRAPVDTALLGLNFGLAIWSPSGHTIDVTDIESAELYVVRTSHGSVNPSRGP